jgi:hypothetical protein
MSKSRIIKGTSRRYETASFFRKQINAGMPKSCKIKFRAQRSDAGKKKS